VLGVNNALQGLFLNENRLTDASGVALDDLKVHFGTIKEQLRKALEDVHIAQKDQRESRAG
jgi:hypothetical protein